MGGSSGHISISCLGSKKSFCACYADYIRLWADSVKSWSCCRGMTLISGDIVAPGNAVYCKPGLQVADDVGAVAIDIIVVGLWLLV